MDKNQIKAISLVSIGLLTIKLAGSDIHRKNPLPAEPFYLIDADGYQLVDSDGFMLTVKS